MALNEGACPSRFPWHSPRKRPPPTVRTMLTTHNKMQGLKESLSEDPEMDEEPAGSFCGSCQFAYRSDGKAEINKPKRTDETSKGKFSKTRGTDCPCRASH